MLSARYQIARFAAIALFLIAPQGIAATGSGTIRIVVAGINLPVGTIRLSLDNNEDTFLGKSTADFQIGSMAAIAPRSEFIFANIPFGTYAIKLFHDANDNEKLDTNLLGIPAEAYGISNDARGVFGLPQFSDAAFAHGDHETQLTIHIRPHLSGQSSH